MIFSLFMVPFSIMIVFQLGFVLQSWSGGSCLCDLKSAENDLTLNGFYILILGFGVAYLGYF